MHTGYVQSLVKSATRPMTLADALRFSVAEGGFLTTERLAVIAREDRLRMLLVRCGNGRFMAPAQDVQHFVDIIQASKKDHVRDISLPTSDPAWR